MPCEWAVVCCCVLLCFALPLCAGLCFFVLQWQNSMTAHSYTAAHSSTPTQQTHVAQPTQHTAHYTHTSHTFFNALLLAAIAVNSLFCAVRVCGCVLLCAAVFCFAAVCWFVLLWATMAKQHDSTQLHSSTQQHTNTTNTRSTTHTAHSTLHTHIAHLLQCFAFGCHRYPLLVLCRASVRLCAAVCCCVLLCRCVLVCASLC